MSNVAVIGTGVVGSAVALALQAKGYRISGVCSKNGVSSAKLADRVGSQSFSDPEDLLSEAGVVLITTPDREIGKVAGKLANSVLIRKEHVFFHMSGALSTEILQPLKDQGALTGSIHPLQTFAGIEQALSHLPGTFFAVQGDPQAVEMALKIVDDLEGNPYLIKDRDKPLYHLGACTASNYLVALVHLSVSMFKQIGMTEEDALKALLPLIKGTLDNIEAMGPVKSLTGPVARGDTETIRCHLRTLTPLDAEIAKVYRALGEYTCQVALAKQSFDMIRAKEITCIFREGEDKDVN